MLLRGMTQIQDVSINRPKLQLDFLDGTNWNISNGNNNATITGLSAGTSANDAVNYQQLTDLFEGIKKRFVARVKAQGNVAALTGAQTIDGVSLVDGDTILLDQQTTIAEDGLWIVRTGAWERHPFWDVGEDVGAYFLFIKEGTDDNRGFVCTNNTGSDIVGTDDLVFIQSSGAGTISADNGLTMTGSNIQLGGALTQNTTISTTTNSFTFTGTGAGGTFNVHVNDAAVISGNQAEISFDNDLTLNANLTILFNDQEVKASSVLNAIPFSMTATTDYGNGNGTSAGDVIDQFRADFTDEAIINALVEIKAIIDHPEVIVEESITVANGTSITLTAGTTTSVIKDVFLNGNRLIETSEFTVGDNGTYRTITEVIANQDFTNGDVVTVKYVE